MLLFQGNAKASMSAVSTSNMAKLAVLHGATIFYPALDSCTCLTCNTAHAYSFLARNTSRLLLLPRVALYGALMLRAGSLMWLAPDCRSWGLPARSSSMRNGLNPLGVGRQFVVSANVMVSRFLACTTEVTPCACMLCA